MGPHEGMYRGAIASEKNDPQFTRTEDSTITFEHRTERQTNIQEDTERVLGYRFAPIKSNKQEKSKNH